MAEFTNQVVPKFDFSEAELLTAEQRIYKSIATAQELSEEFAQYSERPPVPPFGMSDSELGSLAAATNNELPAELRLFLAKCDYLALSDGIRIDGFWVSEEHLTGRRFLVIGDYWQFADGDQLLLDLDDATHPVVAYLHEYGPLFEAFAPSFSLALWRLVHEELA